MWILGSSVNFLEK